MNYLHLLGKELKSDDLLDLLETHDVEVIYDYDRTNENIPDKYWATIHELGMQLRFNEQQRLTTIFLSLTPDDGFATADLGQSDLPSFDSKQEVRDFALQNFISTTEGESEFFGTQHDWIRLDYADYSIHYEFGDALTHLNSKLARWAKRKFKNLRPLRKVTLNITEKQ